MNRSARLVVAAAVMCATHPVIAQTVTSAQRGPLVTTREVGILGVALAGSVLLFSVDRSVADQVRGSSLQQNAFARNAMSGARMFGDPGVVVIGAGLWASGQLGGDRTQRLVGLRSLEAIVVSGAVTGMIKSVTGRARPDQSPGNARDFVIWRGVGDDGVFQSFPSGHTTAAFAFAAAVDAEWRRLSPKRSGWVAPALYGVAALTGISRVFNDRHWASDVLLGGAIGYVAGHAVVRWHADRP